MGNDKEPSTDFEKQRAAMLAAPIELYRSAALAEVPEGVSVARVIEKRWHTINVETYKGLPVEFAIRLAEEKLLERKADLGSLESGYDWHYDFELARHTHLFHLSYLEHNRRAREGQIGFWRQWVENTGAVVRELNLAGLKVLLAIHGAVALGCLNILSQSGKASSAVLAAKWGMFFSLVGICGSGLGLMLGTEWLQDAAGTVRNNLIGNVKWTKVRAFNRYFRRVYKRIRWAGYLLRGSVFWFGIYSLILAIILVS